MNQTRYTNLLFGLNNQGNEDNEGNEGNEKEYILFFDGCSKGNPGISGAGASICENGKEIWFQTVFVGDHETNNVAEYSGLLLGLEEAVRQNIKNITVKGDSELIIKQMRGEYKVKAPNLRKLYKKAKELSNKFNSITFIHIYRQFNQRADELSNKAINII